MCTGIVDQDIDPAGSLVGFRINCRRPMIRGQVAVMGIAWPPKQCAHDGVNRAGFAMSRLLPLFLR